VATIQIGVTTAWLQPLLQWTVHFTRTNFKTVIHTSPNCLCIGLSCSY